MKGRGFGGKDAGGDAAGVCKSGSARNPGAVAGGMCGGMCGVVATLCDSCGFLGASTRGVIRPCCQNSGQALPRGPVFVWLSSALHMSSAHCPGA